MTYDDAISFLQSPASAMAKPEPSRQKPKASWGREIGPGLGF